MFFQGEEADWNPRFNQSSHRVYVFAGMVDKLRRNEPWRQKTAEVRWRVHKKFMGKIKRLPADMDDFDMGTDADNKLF